MKILRLLFLLLACVFVSEGWAETIYRDGILYQTRGSHYVDVVNVYEEAGPDVRFPDSFVYNGVEYTVWEMKLESRRYKDYTDYYLGWNYTGMRSLHLSKNMKFVPFGLCISTLDVMDIFSRHYASEEITVDPGNEEYASYDGCLYSSSQENKHLYLLLCPVQNGKNGIMKLHPDTRAIGECSFYLNNKINTLILPKNVNLICEDAFYNSDIQHLIFEGKYNNDFHFHLTPPALRSITFAESPEKLTFDDDLLINVKKVSPFNEVVEIEANHFSYRRDMHIMHINFPNIKNIGSYVGYPQSITIGDRRHSERTDYNIKECWLDPKEPVILCLNVLTHPVIDHR